MKTITCPYCHKEMRSHVPVPEESFAHLTHCGHCHRPIAVYSQAVFAHRHTDRSIQATFPDESQESSHHLTLLPNAYSEGQSLVLLPGMHILGRTSPHSCADLQLLSSDPDMGRHHLEVTVTDKGVFVKDLDRKGKTHLNAQPLGKGEKRRVNGGDTITIGSSTLLYNHEEQESEYTKDI